MPSILAPVAGAAYKKKDTPYWGAIEVDVETEDVVWLFDASNTNLGVPHLDESGRLPKHHGFRPSSVERLDNGITMISGWSRVMFVDHRGVVIDTFTHPLMNDAHEVQKTSDGTYLVAATGMDTILEFDEEFNEIWRWHMWEHVPESTRPGNYCIHEMKHKDVRHYAMHPDNRYHLNYVTESSGDTVLCSALNYGVFKVHKGTGEIVCSNTSMDECHNPLEVGRELVVPESGRDRVVIADWEDVNRVMFSGGLNFCKDADMIDDDRWLVTDTGNNRVLVWEVGESEPESEFFLGEHTKPYESDYLDGGDSFAQ